MTKEAKENSKEPEAKAESRVQAWGGFRGSCRDCPWGWTHRTGYSHSETQSWSCSRSVSWACWDGSWRDGGRAWWGGRSAWSAFRRAGRRTSSRPCGCGNAGLARLNGQTSCCSLPNGIRRASRLQGHTEKRKRSPPSFNSVFYYAHPPEFKH